MDTTMKVCILDASDAHFIDLVGMGHIAEAARSPEVTVRIVGASPIVRRGRAASRFGGAAPTGEIVG